MAWTQLDIDPSQLGARGWQRFPLATSISFGHLVKDYFPAARGRNMSASKSGMRTVQDQNEARQPLTQTLWPGYHQGKIQWLLLLQNKAQVFLKHHHVWQGWLNLLWPFGHLGSQEKTVGWHCSMDRSGVPFWTMRISGSKVCSKPLGMCH